MTKQTNQLPLKEHDAAHEDFLSLFLAVLWVDPDGKFSSTTSIRPQTISGIFTRPPRLICKASAEQPTALGFTTTIAD